MGENYPPTAARFGSMRPNFSTPHLRPVPHRRESVDSAIIRSDQELRGSQAKLPRPMLRAGGGELGGGGGGAAEDWWRADRREGLLWPFHRCLHLAHQHCARRPAWSGEADLGLWSPHNVSRGCLHRWATYCRSCI